MSKTYTAWSAGRVHGVDVCDGEALRTICMPETREDADLIARALRLLNAAENPWTIVDEIVKKRPALHGQDVASTLTAAREVVK